MSNPQSTQSIRNMDSLALELFESSQLDDSSLSIDVTRVDSENTFTIATFTKSLTCDGKSVNVVLCGSLEPPILKVKDQTFSPLSIGRIQFDETWEPISNEHARTLFTGLQELHSDRTLMKPLDLDASFGAATSDALKSNCETLAERVNLLAQLKSEIREIYPEKWKITTSQVTGETTAVVTSLRLHEQDDDESFIEMTKIVSAVETDGTRTWCDPEYSISIQNTRGMDELTAELGQDEIKQLFCDVLVAMK